MAARLGGVAERAGGVRFSDGAAAVGRISDSVIRRYADEMADYAFGSIRPTHSTGFRFCDMLGGFGKMMKFARIVRSFFQVVSRMIREDRGNRITFSDRVYMHPSDGKITLMSLAIDNVQAIELSINDAREIFQSIKRACDLHQVEEIKTDDWSWKTDAHVGLLGQGTVIIKFYGPMGSTTEALKREAVAAAVIEFTRKFGLDESPLR